MSIFLKLPINYSTFTVIQKITPISLIPDTKVSKLIEQRLGFSLNTCELNIYETRKAVDDFPLSFDGFTITSMLRGTKKVRFKDLISREYVPGNTIIAPAKKELKIDFVESSFKNPTQCTALTLDNTLVKTQLNEFNEVLYKGSLSKNIDVLDSAVFLYNNEELVSIQQKITAIAASNDPFKEIHVKILLKELVLCVLKMKHLNILNADAAENTNNTPFAAIINFIRQNIYNTISIEDLLQISCMSKSTFYRAFVDQLGISPYQLIINERLKIAKNLLLEERLSIKETAYASGFSSPNYFIRLFKKYEGITPKQFVNSKLNIFL